MPQKSGGRESEGEWVLGRPVGRSIARLKVGRKFLLSCRACSFVRSFVRPTSAPSPRPEHSCRSLFCFFLPCFKCTFARLQIMCLQWKCSRECCSVCNMDSSQNTIKSYRLQINAHETLLYGYSPAKILITTVSRISGLVFFCRQAGAILRLRRRYASGKRQPRHSFLVRPENVLWTISNSKHANRHVSLSNVCEQKHECKKFRLNFPSVVNYTL